MKKLFYSLGTLVILFLIGLGIKESFFVNDTPKKDSDSNMSISVSDDSEFVNAIEEAKADYETVTEIVLTSDVTLTSEINIKNGQNIKIVNQVNGVEIGQTDLGHTLTVNSTISIDRQASLSLQTNTTLGSNGTIMASDDNNATNTDFNAELAILDSLTINSNGSLNTSMFKELDLSGSINLVGGEITGDGTLNVNKEAGIIQTAGTYEDTVKFTGEGLFVTTGEAAPSGLEHSITEATALGETFTIKDDSNNDVPVTSGTYILTNNTYDLGSLTLTGNLNLFSICDTKINVGASNNITVNKGYSLNIGGINEGTSFYSAGTNQIVIDGGATWAANPSGNYYFVTSAYEAGMDLKDSSVENYGRSQYSASGRTSTTPTIRVTGNGTTLNLYRGVTLQNRINTQTADNGENVGGAISLYGDSTDNRVNLNINGASIRYNALTNIQNSAGGAGIGAQNGDINFIYGDVSYNTLYDLLTSRSSDGAGISLVNNSNLTMEEGSKVSYNHGNHDSDADGGGIMVRVGSDLTINGGEVSYNFTYGFGGGICIYTSNVTINNGLVYGNRSTYGGGISTSGTSNVTLGEEGESSNLEVAFNTAFTHPDNASSGFGGGVALGNNGATNYLYNQNLYVNDGLIHNNTAVYGGGISNYSTGNSNNNKLHLSGGIISDNKASSSNQGDGIYAINNTKSGTEPLVVMSGDIQVSTSNNIVFAGLTNETTIAVDNSNWQYWENDNTYKYNWGTLVINNVNCESGSTNYNRNYIVLEPAGTNGNDSTYNFQITPTVDIKFSALMAKKNGLGEKATLRITNTTQSTHKDIDISNYSFGSDRQYIDLEANNTYKFTSNSNNNHVCITDIRINNGQTPISVSSQLTATGIVGLISYADSNQYITNSVLANYTTGNAQADKFIIDNTNYRIETSGKQVLIVQNTDNIIAYVNNEPFSNLTDAIKYIEKSNLKTATIEIINNVNLQATDFITIPTGYNITIKSSDSVPPYTLNIPSNINITGVTNTTLFTVSSGASLTLDNIIIEGNSTQSSGYLIVENNGTFTLTGDATINNNLGIDGYASAIEIGRGDTTTNIYGSITNNIGDYGAIYLSNSEAVVNVYDSAIITGNTYTGSTDGLENITDADIFIENGTLNLNNFSGKIGTIIKQGSGSIKANNIDNNRDNTTPINIKLNGNNYVRNNVVVEVEDNNDYSSKFKLLEPQDDKGYDSLIKENDGYNIILNMVLTIEISFEDIWQRNGNSYNKITDINNVNISDAKFDTLDELANLRTKLGLSYDIDYHVGESALFFYIDSTSQLVFTNLANEAARSGYYLNGFVRHGLDETTSNTFYGMDSFISVQNFTNETSHIYLGVEWLPEQYTLEFNNGGLSTANQTMANQTIPYSVFETSLPTIKHNLYFATGFYFKGWKVRTNSNSYVQYDGSDLILANRAQITPEILNTILSQTNSNTFVLEADWGRIFGDVNLAHVGTSSDAAFEISTKAGLEALADTVNGNNKTYDGYDYYTNIDSNGKGSFEAFSYDNYYFKITANINDVSKVIGSIVDLGDDYFTSEDAQKPIQGEEVLKNGKPFSGTLDGGSNTINININDSNNKDFVGLFAYTKDATITNIKIAGSVSGRISVGSLVGLAYGGTYRNIESDADVAFNGINAGGIFGTYYIEQSRYIEGSITNVVNRGDVTYSPINNDPSETTLADGATWAENQILYAYQGSRAGGIVGQSWHLTLREAYNSGNISARFGVGGIVGTMISENDSTRDDSVVNTAFNSGKIEATSGLLANYTYNNDGNVIKQVNAYAGGIAGRMYGASTLTNSMNIGEVSATWTGALNNDKYEYTTENPTLGARGVGGILGVTSIDVSGPSLAGGNKTVSNVINTGKVSAWTHVGGIAGILAYSDLSYALNSGIVTATGKTGDSKGGFTYNGNHYNFMGALVGLGVSASVSSTAVFDGDIEYSGYTDSIIQAIGDDIANENNDASFIGYPLNSSNALKLASSHLVCQPNDQKPLGLDSTFFDSGWVWKSYSDEGNSYRYYPQLVSFSASSVVLNDSKTVSELSKEAVRLTNIDDKPIDDEYTVKLTLDLQGGVFADSGISIDGIIFTLEGNTLVSDEINYLTHQTINLATIEALMSYESYYFAGWYRDSSFSEEFDGTISSTDETIYVKWEPRAYNINLIGLQQYANAGVELADDTLLTYTIEDTMGSGKTFILPTIKENKAYSFSHYEITLNGGTFNATSFNIVRQENGQYLLTFYYGSAQEQTSIRTLSQLDFTLICNPINYNIEYSYYDNINNEEITVQNPNQPTFNINSTFGLVNPNISGYDFVGWYLDDTLLTDYTIANVVEKLIENGVEGLGDIKLVAKYEPQELTLSLNLNGGNFKDAISGQVTLNLNSENYKFTRNEQGLWVTTVLFGNSLAFINEIKDSHIIAPAGRTFKGISYSLDGETVEIPETMPAGGIQLFVIYTETTYDIEVVIGDTNNITYDINAIANALDDTYLIKVVDNKLYITISYGEDATEVLDAIRGMVNSNNYHFGGYDAKNDNDTFNYTNVRLAENNNPTITFLWQLDSYTVAIFDSLGNFISQFNTTNDESISWISGNSIDIKSLKNNIDSLWNGHSVTGYDNSQNFLILKDNSTVYDSTSSTETTIDITGYTIIRLVLTPKEYDITFNTNYGSEITGTYSLSYNQQIDLDSLPKTTKPGYDFVGWTYNGNLLIDNDIFIPTTSDLNGNSITLTAEYREATYNISFNIKANRYWNGALTKESITFTYDGEEITLDSDFFSFEGYNFNEEEDTYGATYNGEICRAINNSFVKSLGELRNITIDVTLEIKQISITFDAGEKGEYDFNEADLARGNNAYYLVTLYGSPIKNNTGETLRYYVVVVDYYSTANRYLPSNPQRPGYTYSNYSSDNGVLIQDTLENDQTFNANYSADTYTVIYINDNVSTSIEAEYNEVITLPTYTKEGYDFKGFVVQGTNEPLITGTYTVTGDVVLVAQYEGDYNLIISVSDDELKTSILNVLKDILTDDSMTWPDDNTFSIPYGTDLSRLNNITSSEKIVSYTKDDSPYQFSSMPAEEITVSATLEKTKKYITVTFEVKDGNSKVIYETSYYAYYKDKERRYYLLDTNISINIKGYTFDNIWYHNNDVYDLNDGFTDKTTLYGTASKIDYELTYEYYNNGTLTTNTITVYYGDTIGHVLENVVNNRPGYKFLYWTYLNGNTDVKNDKIKNNVVVVPYFENVNYQVKFTYSGVDLSAFDQLLGYGQAVRYPSINDLGLGNNANYYNLNYSNGYNLLHNNNDLMTNLDLYFNGGNNEYGITFDNSTYTITIELTKEAKEFTLHFINGNLDDVKFKYGDISITIDLSECEVPQHYNIGGIGVTDVKKVEIKASYTFDDLISLFVDPTLNTTQEVKIIYEATEYKVNYGEYSVSFTVNDTIIDISNLNQYVITNPGQEFVGFKIADNDNLDLLFNNFIRFTDIESLLSKEKTSITLEPQFEAISINVIYNDLIGNYYSIEVDYGTTYKDALAILEALEGYTTPNRQGYTFNGWYNISDGTQTITRYRVFNAIWVANTYKIYFELTENESFVVSSNLKYDAEKKLYYVEQAYGHTINYLPNVIKDNYNFNGWQYNNEVISVGNLYNYAQDIYLTANTSEKDYTITFVLNNGEASKVVTVKFGSDISQVIQHNFNDDLSREGYTFDGWSQDSGQVLNNLVITAKWEANKYTVTFNNNGNTSTQKFTYDEAQTLTLNSENRPGYRFMGWSTSENGSVAYTDGASVINLTSNKDGYVNLYAKWEANTYTVTFNNNGDISTQPFTYDQEQALTKNDTDILGYVFKGWATTPGGDVVYQDGEEVSNLTTIPNGNINLYAFYEIVEYTIIYQYDDSNNEYIVVTINDFVEQNDSYIYSLKDYSKLGYTFDGWNILNDEKKKNYKELTFAELSELAVDNKLKLTANLTPITYTLSFASNGGTSVEDITIKIDTNIDDILANTTERTGYTFNGWYNGNGEEVDEISDIIKANDSTTITIYADWIAIEYTINFVVNDDYGTLNGENSVTLNYDEAYTLPSVTANSNYNFLYWTDGKNNYQAGANVINLASEKTTITLTAVFEFIITFNGNGGTGTVSSISGIIDSNNKISVILPSNGFTREHYRFMGWSTTQDGDPTYQPSEVYTSLAQPLYAIWKAEEYTINYYDGTSLVGSDTYTYGIGKDELLTITKPGYKFAGWHEDSSLADEYKVDSIGTAESGDITLYAKFNPNVITTTINISNVVDGFIDEFIADLKEIAGEQITISKGTTSITITYDATYSSGNRSILNRLFGRPYNYNADGVTYTLNPYSFAEDVPSENEPPYNLAFYQTNISIILNFRNGDTQTIGLAAPFILTDTYLQSFINNYIGYEFVGWYQDRELENLYVFNDSPLTGQLNLYAKYEAISFTINYDNDEQEVTYDDNSLIKDSSKDGYTFLGWSTSENGSVQFKANGSINDLISYLDDNNNVKLYSVYQEHSVVIYFDKNNDNATGNMSDINLYYSDLENFNLPSSSFNLLGYQFNNWSYKYNDKTYNDISQLNEHLKEILQNPNGEITLLANYQIINYDIIYVLDGGTNDPSNPSKYNVTSDVTFKDPTRDGYTFDGWYTDSQFSNIVDNIEKGTTGNIILYANWEANTYTITFDLGDGESLASGASQELEVKYLDQINNLPNATKGNYTFGGWLYNGQTIIDGMTYIWATDITLTPVFRLNDYTITINLAGGNIDSNSGSITNVINYNDNILEKINSLISSNPVRLGYEFIGWSLNGSILTGNELATSSIEVVAVWEIINYTIIYSDSGYINNPANVSQYNIELGTITLYAPTKDGYNFIGWYLGENQIEGINISNFEDTDSITLVPKFEAKEYEVTYINELANSEVIKTIKYDEILDLINGEEIAGYEFVGWYLDNVKIEDGIAFNYLNNITLVARYNIINYTITYELDGGTNNLSNPSTYNVENIITFANPTKTGYRFTGWTYNDKDITSTEGLTGNITVKANWEIINYDITYVLDGGTNNPSNPSTYNVEDNVTFEDPTKTGYTFAGWYTDSKFSDKVDSITKGTTGNITLYAKWEANTYTVTFNNNGNISSQTFTYDVAQGLTPNSQTRPGYRFMGWSTSKNGSVAYTDGASVINLTSDKDGNVNLYAVWEIVSYTITYELDGGTNNPSNPTTYNVEDNVTFENPTKTGYTFTGWTYNDEPITSTEGLTGNITVKANYVANTYTVTFNNNGNISTQTFTYDEAQTLTLNSENRPGYRFMGWSLSENGSVAYADGASVINLTSDKDGNVNLYAVWEIVSYTITYELDGGTNNQSNPTTYTVEDNVTFANPTKTGYTFAGWTYNDEPITSTEGLTGNITVKSNYVANTYTVTFNNNGNISTQTFTYDVAQGLTPNSITRPGYRFMGWSLSENGSVAYTDGASVINLTSNKDGNVNLYAVWEIVSYTITYELDGGINNSSNPTTYTVEDNVTFANPTKTGYTFTGWTYDDEPITSTEGLTGNIIVKANYVANKYQIHFDVDGLVEIDSIEVTYNQRIGDILPVLDLDTLVFNYWYYLEDDRQVTINKDTVYLYDHDITVKAELSGDYNVVYETNGGINSNNNPTRINVDELNESILLENPTRNGYTFDGWYLTSDFSSDRVYEITLELLANANNATITLYAKWNINSYNVNYVDQDGEIIKTETLNYGSYLNFFTPTKEGQIFDNWYLNGTVFDFNTPVTSDITLVAMYRLRQLSTTVTINGDIINVVVSSIDGLGIQADARIVITLIEENHVLNPVEELLAAFGIVARLYDIQLVDSNNNPIEPNGEVRVELTLPSKTLENDKTYTLYHIADNLAEYELMDSTIRNGNIEFYTTHFSYYAIVISDKVVSFLWLWILLGVLGVLLIQAIIIIIVKTRKYKITFISRGNIQVKSVKYKKDERVILPKPERLGYIFGGWYIDSKFSQPANIKTMPNQNIMLYAKWYEDPITIGLRINKNK